jgi:DNA-binding transcriptional MerR regulator
MSKQSIDDLVLEYIREDCSDERRQNILAQLRESGYEIEELEQLRKLNGQLDDLPNPKPSERLDKNFYAMLAEQNRKINTNYIQTIIDWIKNLKPKDVMLQPAFGLLLFLSGLISGYLISENSGNDNQLNAMTAEIREMKTMVTISMLNQDSPSERMRTINAIQGMELQEDQVIYALLKTLNEDPNVNVRLSALNLLDQASDQRTVQYGLINSIAVQESPLLQIALVDILGSMEDKESISVLRNVAMRKDLHYSVRNKINQLLKVLI